MSSTSGTTSSRSRSINSCLICRLRRKRCSEPPDGESCDECKYYRLRCLPKQGRSISTNEENSKAAKKALREITGAIDSRETRTGIAGLPYTSAFLESLEPSPPSHSPSAPPIGQHIEHVEPGASPSGTTVMPAPAPSPTDNLLEDGNNEDATTSLAQERTLDPMQDPIIAELEPLSGGHAHPDDPGHATGLITHQLGYCHCGEYHSI